MQIALSHMRCAHRLLLCTLRDNIKHMHLLYYQFAPMAHPPTLPINDELEDNLEDTYYLLPLPHIGTLTIQHQSLPSSWGICHSMMLTQLTLSDVPGITDNHLYRIAFFLKQLQQFSLQYTDRDQILSTSMMTNYNHYVSFYSLFYLGRYCQSLQRIAFSDISLSPDHSGSSYSKNHRIPRLPPFYRSNVDDAHEQSFQNLLQTQSKSLFTSINSLDLRHCSGLARCNDQSPLIRLLGILKARGQELDSLNVSSTDISEETVEIISQTYCLQNVSLFSCPNVSDHASIACAQQGALMSNE